MPIAFWGAMAQKIKKARIVRGAEIQFTNLCVSTSSGARILKGTMRTEFKVRKILPLLFLKQNVSLQNLSLPPFKKNSLQNLSLLRVADPIDRVG